MLHIWHFAELVISRGLWPCYCIDKDKDICSVGNFPKGTELGKWCPVSLLIHFSLLIASQLQLFILVTLSLFPIFVVPRVIFSQCSALSYQTAQGTVLACI